MQVLVDGKEKELTIFDANGVDYANDLLGDHGALDYDDDEQMSTMSADDFEWWSDFLVKYNASKDAQAEYVSTLDQDAHENFYKVLGEWVACDLEDLPAATMAAIAEHKASTEKR